MGTSAASLAERVEKVRLRGANLTNIGHPAAASRCLRSALRMLGWPAGDGGWTDNPALTARTLISLGLAEAEQGDTEQGLRSLDAAETLLAPNDRGNLLQQRGLVLERAGRTREALILLDAAIALLGDTREPFTLACALLNRSMLHFSVGRVPPARHDLLWCGRLAAEHGFDLIGAKVAHNLGYCDVLEGDIPEALKAFDVAGRRYAVHGPGCLPTLAMDKARALLAAGLAREASTELDGAFGLFRHDRLSADYAWAELTRAQASLLAGDARAAHLWATRAGDRFRRSGDNVWAALCELTRVKAALLTTTRPGLLVTRARRVAEQLRQGGLRSDADIGALLAIRAMLCAGRLADAQDALAGLGHHSPRASLEGRLLRHLVRAELARRAGARGRALGHCRDGLASIEKHRRYLGSIELRAGASALGAELAVAGLDCAIGSGSPRLVFAWSERSRAQALRTRSVRPPADLETREALSELRQLSHLARAHELEGRRDPSVQRRRAQLERVIRDKDWQQQGTSEATDHTRFAVVAGALARAHRKMVSYLDHDGRLLALVIQPTSIRLVELGRTEVVVATARRLTRDLDALCGRRLPAALEDVIRQSIRHHAGCIEQECVDPLRKLLGDDEELIIVPTPALAGVPWSILPGLRGRPITVALSAHMWTAAWKAAAATPDHEGAAVLVAGPHLAHAEMEIDQIAVIHPVSDRLTGAGATVEETIRALDGARLAHIAAHGHHVMDNILFSRLDLADGPLMAYDVHGLKAAPGHVVLSACDVGQASARAGNEALGFTAALLHAGTTTVISSVARVPDDLAVPVMIRYHRAISAGTAPARALAEAAGDTPLLPFVCFGAG